MLLFATFILLAYLLGSIPTAVLYARIVHGVDIRKHGSGNAGATNSQRVLGNKAGIAVLLVDVFKGFLAVKLAHYFLEADSSTLILIGFAAVIGHLMPVFASFKGGKGVATSFGIILAIDPFAALICLIVFILVLKIFRYVSLASLLSSFSFLIYCYWKNSNEHFFLAMCFTLFLLLVFTHRENVSRLIKGNENKFPAKKN